MVNEFIVPLFEVINEMLAAAIVIISISLLLYNISRNRDNRVARSSGWVLAAVTFSYLIDVFISLQPSLDAQLIAARLQWLGFAFIPSTLFHLSDALLATTGLPSRGRRRAVVRMLYILSILFSLGAIFTDWVAIPTLSNTGVRFSAAPLFYVYMAYFLMALVVVYINVNRARRRCLTDSTRRRMTYLQISILTPAIAIFPYSVFLPSDADGVSFSLMVQLLVNIANIIVIVMLIFLAYPLSFFGSNVPDRVVRAKLLRFLLRGPGTGLLALGVILFTGSATEILSLPVEAFTPFAVVVVVMFWQWMIDLALPFLERRLIYGDEEDEQLAKLQDLSERIITGNDLVQLIGATIETMADYLRTEIAFVASFNGKVDVVQTTGNLPFDESDLNDQIESLRKLLKNADRVTGRSAFQAWDDFQVVPLYSQRIANGEATPMLIGVLGILTDENPVTLVDDEDADLLYTYVQRAEQSLDDMLLQDEIFSALEGLLPQISSTRQRANEVEYRVGRTKPEPKQLPTRDEAYEQVRAALKHYWGGTGLTRSRLLELSVVQDELNDAETPIEALRTVLTEAIEKLKPKDEQRSMTATEWTLYNIIELRFVEGKRVRDVARRMSLSEPDLYRKQRSAIQAVADAVIALEREHIDSHNPS